LTLIDKIAEIIYKVEMIEGYRRTEGVPFGSLPFHRKLHYQYRAKFWIKVFKALKS